ncbi:hypothetical protein CPHO_11885 [Corynebacterium phocae]|uniref:Uncharacterized protein n=1 Tax=Corynebacterium phocae TaxID=161895 RepID=A0A1L7D5U1_9CORY|nr:hypothetical protein [Corynebacterium phocae]APT93475.1 hypothetical protein CPHO_11885 [Corynebacterium phocae]KAA8721035.1 hypothetical protein F4V58_11340 [Corynebacterium phocae]
MTWEHPENDLERDIDRANLVRPEPKTFDDLADAPDPARNAQSSRQAFWFLVTVTAVSLILGLGSLLIFRLIGGPDCGPNTWICSDTQRFIWMPLAFATPLFGLAGAFVITLRKLRAYLRWGVWMGVFWFFALYFLLWGINILQVFLDWQLANSH